MLRQVIGCCAIQLFFREESSVNPAGCVHKKERAYYAEECQEHQAGEYRGLF